LHPVRYVGYQTKRVGLTEFPKLECGGLEEAGRKIGKRLEALRRIDKGGRSSYGGGEMPPWVTRPFWGFPLAAGFLRQGSINRSCGTPSSRDERVRGAEVKAKKSRNSGGNINPGGGGPNWGGVRNMG